MSDTPERDSEVYWQRLREMTPTEKVNLTAQLTEAADLRERAALHQQYPDADEDEITYRLVVSRYGEELARKAYGR